MSERTIPPWTRLPCDNCGADHLGSRGNSVTAERFICEECETWERVEKDVEARIEAAFRAGVEAMRNGSLQFMRFLGVRFDRKVECAIMSVDADDLLQRREWSEYKKGDE